MIIEKRYILASIRAAIEAGKAILEVYETDFRVDHKDDDSPLTLADKRSHEIIVASLGKFDIPILSEEGRDITFGIRKTWDRLWLVDPLDGTKEFIKRNDEFTVNIALIQNGLPVMGVIFVPVGDVLYFAARGLGTFKLADPRALASLAAPSKEAEASDLLDLVIKSAVKLPCKMPLRTTFTIVGSRSHAGPELEGFLERNRRKYGDVDLISAGSSLKFCLVAEGRAMMYPRFGPTMEWDTAAGQAIAENAEARVLDFHTNDPLRYNKENLLNPWFLVLGPESQAETE